MVEFSVTHTLTPGKDAKWRASTPDGKLFSCGNSSRGMRERGQYTRKYETSDCYRIFAWMSCGPKRDQPFCPDEVLPIPRYLEEEEKVMFAFGVDNKCRPSHMVVFVRNDTNKTVKVEVGNVTENIHPRARHREIAFRTPPSYPDQQLSMEVYHMNSSISTSSIIVENGDTIIVGDVSLKKEKLRCPFPEYDIPIRCINRSGRDASVVAQTTNGETLRTGIQASEDRIFWLEFHPSFITWSIDDITTQKVPYTSGMTLTIRTPQAVEASKKILGSGFAGSEQFVELLEEAGELERCADLFCLHFVEFQQLPLLTERDWEMLKIPIGSRLRIQEQLGRLRNTTTTTLLSRRGQDTTTDTSNNNEYDVFISHRHEGGEDLAQAIKLQLQVMFPTQHLRIFLDVDNLRDLDQLEKHVRNSAHFLLLLTPGALERPFIQKEILTALNAKKNIIVVHDIKNCPLPDDKLLPTNIQPIMARICIPYYRQHSFRETAVKEIASAIGLSS